MASSKLKTPLKTRTQSPGQHLLSPNNDEYEKVQARAARAAAIRRKSFVGMENLDPENTAQCRSGQPDLLSKEQILDLYQNCIKLATENKINQRNSWELGLLDHLSEIIRADDEEDAETNFQKASCTLEAGVKIYSYRVDSVHAETYKVLGGLNRTTTDSRDDVQSNGNDQEDDNDEGEEQGNSGKDLHKKTSATSATLESSYDAINVKKFDVAFTVDPMFHQMSAQFDEGGAKGLLLNTLSIYSGCSLLFDSNEIPTKKPRSEVSAGDMSAMIDLSFMKDCLDQMKATMFVETEISPTLKEIVKLLDDPYRAAAAAAVSGHGLSSEACFWIDDQTNDDMEDRMSEVVPAGPENHAEDPAVFNAYMGTSPDSVSWVSNGLGREDNNDYVDNGELEEDSYIDDDDHTVNWIAAGLGLASKNAWAGPEHWKYRKLGDDHLKSHVPHDADEKKKKKTEKFSLDFANPVDIDMAAFAPPSDPRSLLLPQSKSLASTLLPEDCHYQAEDLVKLFLLPSVMCINRKGKVKTAIRKSNELDGSQFGMQYDDDDAGVAGNWDDENAHSDVDDPIDGSLIPQPRKVQKVEVNYDKLSKQVDVRVLKETLWEILQHVLPANLDTEAFSGVDTDSQGSSFQKLLTQLSSKNTSAGFQDVSVHLCFICLLHLANENNLCIEGCSDLNDLLIYNVNSK